MTLLDQVQHAIGIGCQLTFAGAGGLAFYAAVSTAWPQRHRILAALCGEHLLPAASVAPALATALPPQHDDEAVVLPTRKPATAVAK